MPEPDWLSARRVAYYDPRYHTSWIAHSEAEVIAATLEEQGGFRVLGAKDLRKWMLARVPDDADLTVCVMAQDVAPDTVYETADAKCLIRRYMDSGGRVVWSGDMPFVFQGRRWGGKGHLSAYHTVLGIVWVREPKGAPLERATEAGLKWGLSKDRGESITNCAHVEGVTALSRIGDAAPTFHRNFNPRFPLSGFIKIGGGGISATGADMEERLTLATHGLGEARPGHWLFAQEPEPAPAPPAEGVLVESGTFRVDRGRALEKLMKFQLEEEEMFVLPLARCAAAAGAGKAELRLIRRGLEFSFDASPFAPEALADPFGALFAEAPKEADRQLALGLISALRTRPKMLEVVSGSRTLQVRGVSDYSISTSGSSSGTRIRVLWSNVLDGLFHGMRAKGFVRGFCKACAPWLQGVSPPGGGELFPALEFDEDGIRGCITMPAPLTHTNLDIYHFGVLAGNAKVWTWPAPVCGWVDARDIGVDMSLRRVVRDKRFDETLFRLRGPERRLAEKALPEFNRLMPEAAGLMRDGHWRGVWTQVVAHPGDPVGRPRLARALLSRARVFKSLGASSTARALEVVVRAAWMASWFRAATGCIPKETPLYFTADCGTMSLARLEELGKRLGRIPCVTEPQPERPDAKEVLLFLDLGDYRLLTPDWTVESLP